MPRQRLLMVAGRYTTPGNSVSMESMWCVMAAIMIRSNSSSRLCCHTSRTTTRGRGEGTGKETRHCDCIDLNANANNNYMNYESRIKN